MQQHLSTSVEKKQTFHNDEERVFMGVMDTMRSLLISIPDSHQHLRRELNLKLMDLTTDITRRFYNDQV